MGKEVASKITHQVEAALSKGEHVIRFGTNIDLLLVDKIY